MPKDKQTNRKSEGNIYDKIFRENLLEIFMPLVAKHLKVKIKSVQPLPDKPLKSQRTCLYILILKTITCIN